MRSSKIQYILNILDDSLLYFATALLLAILVIVGYNRFYQPAKKISSTQHSDLHDIHKKALSLVNQNLKRDESLHNLRQKKIELNNQTMKEAYGASLAYAPPQVTNYDGLDTSVDDGSEDVYEDIYGDQGFYDSELTPADRIEAKILKMKMLEEYDYQRKLAFIEAFIENARKQGYLITINENLEVTRVKREDPVGGYRGFSSLEKLSNR